MRDDDLLNYLTEKLVLASAGVFRIDKLIKKSNNNHYNYSAMKLKIRSLR